jgi:hypothetical protein
VHIALVSAFVSNVSGSALTIPVSDYQRSQIDPQLRSLDNLATTARNQAEKAITEEDIGRESSEFFTVASYADVIAHELEEIALDLKQGTDFLKIRTLARSIAVKARESAKLLAGWPKSLASDILKNAKTAAYYAGKALEDKLVLFVSKIADALQRFVSALIGSLFTFASFVQKIAETKDFALTRLTIQVPSFETKLIMVGHVPVPIPKLSTPSLAIEFTPKLSSS